MYTIVHETLSHTQASAIPKMYTKLRNRFRNSTNRKGMNGVSRYLFCKTKPSAISIGGIDATTVELLSRLRVHLFSRLREIKNEDSN
jgi:hypothetical protein